ncbi:MAG: WD40 repeat domain-containing protein [Planctomycetes bacterium]|nr:WD40 repeat domain-containing protein [Planctomycetota bacterium]
MIDAFDEPVLTMAVSPDGRLLAAATARELAIWDWLSGEELNRRAFYGTLGQLAFGPTSEWLACGFQRGMFEIINPRDGTRIHGFPGTFSGGVAVSPNAKEIVATQIGRQGQVELELWELPGWRRKRGYDGASPFTRLAFSPDGEHIAGITVSSFELRYAASGGINHRQGVNYVGEGFFSFSQDSQTVVFGWESTLHVMETRNGNVSRRVMYQEPAMLVDVAFLGSRQFATVDGSPLMRMWSAESWKVVHGFDWNSGGLTCVIPSADGLAGICGTKTGKLVVFDVDD